MSEFFEAVPGGIHLNGYPTAERVIRLTGKRATRFAHLALHLHDLQFAGECLEQLRSETHFPDIAREALWRSAVVHYLKCFSDSAARFSLDSTIIFDRGIPQQVHQYFRDLRNKHLVHDDNPYLQALPAGIIGRLGDTPKVQEVIVLSMRSDTLTPENLGNLDLLLNTAHHWVQVAFDKAQASARNELEQVDHAELLMREQANVRVPTVEDLSTSREQ
jgi:hypothetical protein